MYNCDGCGKEITENDIIIQLRQGNFAIDVIEGDAFTLDFDPDEDLAYVHSEGDCLEKWLLSEKAIDLEGDMSRMYHSYGADYVNNRISELANKLTGLAEADGEFHGCSVDDIMKVIKEVLL